MRNSSKENAGWGTVALVAAGSAAGWLIGRYFTRVPVVMAPPLPQQVIAEPEPANEEWQQRLAADVAWRDQEIDRLWARIHSLEPQAERLRVVEGHHLAAVADKNEEILSLIRRLKEFEQLPEMALVARFRQRLTECETALRELRLRSREPVAVEVADDLKLIYGIGPVLERRLNGLGVTRFEQMGRWNDAEIDAYQERLPEYPGAHSTGCMGEGCARGVLAQVSAATGSLVAKGFGGSDAGGSAGGVKRGQHADADG